MSEAEAMGHFLHDIMNPDPQPGPPCAHTFSPGTDEELAADTLAVLATFAEMVRFADRYYGSLKEELGDDRVLECLDHAASCVRTAAMPPAHTVTS